TAAQTLFSADGGCRHCGVADSSQHGHNRRKYLSRHALPLYNQSLTWRKGCGFCIKKDGDLCHVAPGGTKCWAVFSGDTPPALLCLNAEIEIVGPSGAR